MSKEAESLCASVCALKLWAEICQFQTTVQWGNAMGVAVRLLDMGGAHIPA